MAVVGANAAGRLPCGTPLAELVEQAVGNPAAARPGQPGVVSVWCGRALMSSNETRRRLRELAGEEVTVPAGLVSNVMRAVGERAAARGRR